MTIYNIMNTGHVDNPSLQLLFLAECTVDSNTLKLVLFEPLI